MYIISSIKGYIYGTKPDEIKKVKVNRSEKVNTIKDIYLVLNRNSQSPLGIYSSKELAISNGTSSTYHNCTVIKYVLNDKCNFLNNNIVYEDK